ncbi:protein CpxP [Pseudomonas sp. SORGH_AS199]|jgi:Spy/CpxP family protein refolding chaperone|uniref:LTXXQ domain protein n=1 Tax=Pseudomonas flavocrustae TaxID=2991719 RepID=A0ABT6IH47_9PSED|nr:MULTISPECIES: LTXXQ domain protein [Pseudomonas]MDH4763170.1 LTXXQ domain protein [Pseudomonas sp. CBMAI 2609]MDK8266576.1 LTXXQ domain protein [Pseudomonas oryzihabitans]MDR6230572.1 protein CpxP [Pseudomonas sp. SORGH_AS_0199]QNQ99565.1 LTXXQ domain protein [Pseudomonas psychrotolerans]
MRKLMPAVLFAALLPTLTLAATQDSADIAPPPHGKLMDGGPRGDGPLRGLKLTPEQREQVGKLMGEERQQQREIVKSYLDKLPEDQRKALHDQLDGNRDKTRQSIRALLKPDQQKRFDEMEKKREDRAKEWAEFQQWKQDHKSS